MIFVMSKKINSNLIIVSNRLPYTQETDSKGTITWQKSAGGLVSALDPIARKMNTTWIGWTGNYQQAPYKDEHWHIHKIENRVKKNTYKIVSVPMSKQDVEMYYNQFSNNTLWGLFHYFFEKSKINYESWDAYKTINKRFAEVISRNSKKNDIVWIQDYQLFLTPYYLKKLKPSLKVNFFLHIPFPHVDIFSILPWNIDILESLTCCNSIGFHHKRYKKNFDRAMNLHYDEICQRKNIKNIKIPTSFVSPISIDYAKFNNESKKKGTINSKNKIKEENNGSKIIIGVDRLDYSKGIKEKIIAIETLLDKRPDLIEKIVLFQLAIPSREDVSDYKQLKKEVDELIGRINGKFSTAHWYPIHYMYTTMEFNELVALYMAGDIGLVTPLRDGMNLVCKEYIASHSDIDGVLILSKFAGASSEIRNAISVNPYSIDHIAKSIEIALNMPKKERKKRMERMRRNVRTHNLETWVNKCTSFWEE